MTTANERLVTPRDIARIFFRQWRKISLCFGGVLAATLLIIALYPRSYASEAKLLIRVGRETVGLDPTATTGETIMLQKTQDDEVNSAINILTSREVLEGVVQRVGAKRILQDRHSAKDTAAGAESQSADGGSWIAKLAGSIGLMDPGTEMDRAIRRLESRCAVGSQKQSMVISVKYTAASPELAHDVVSAITSVFLEERSRLNQTDGSLAFFAEQAEKLHMDLTAAQAKLRDRKNAYQMTSSTNRQSIVEKGKEALLQKLYDLEIQESELRSRYTSDYPPLRQIQRQRQEAQELLINIPSDAKSFQANAGSVPQTAQQSDSARQQSKLHNEVQTLNDQEFELAQLEREVRLLEGKYKMHVEKLEQARLNDALGREQITNVKIAQAATLVHKPVAPKKSLILGLGILVALFGSIGLAFLVESFDQTLRTTDQVEMQLGLPVLASLPLRKGRRKQQKRQLMSSSTASQTHESVKLSVSRQSNYQGLLTALQSNGENANGNAKAVGIVGCDTSKMRSWVAGDIAIQAANSGKDSVLLIDGDARRQRIAKRFRLNGDPGWRELLAGSVAAESCVKWSQPNNLAVMGPGHSNGEVSDADSSIGTLCRLNGIKSEYGLVVVDLPLSREQEGPPVAAEWFDEMVLVVEAERTRIQAAQRAKDLLDRAGVRVLGVVLTNRREHIPRWLYQRL